MKRRQIIKGLWIAISLLVTISMVAWSIGLAFIN